MTEAQSFISAIVAYQETISDVVPLIRVYRIKDDRPLSFKQLRKRAAAAREESRILRERIATALAASDNIALALQNRSPIF